MCVDRETDRKMRRAGGRSVMFLLAAWGRCRVSVDTLMG